jgi:Mrp family chromosome partitioning ATPase
LRSRYDYILVDTPQADNLADAEILGRHTDSSISVIRAGVFKLNDLDTLKETDEKAGKQYVVLNGVSVETISSDSQSSIPA